jgi:hypothetical protein
MGDRKDTYRLRVENCLDTIIDVHKRLGVEYETGEIRLQFKKMQHTIEKMNMHLLCEGDILMVEEATNALLDRFQALFNTGNLGSVYKQQKS